MLNPGIILCAAVCYAGNTTSQPFERCIRSRVSIHHKVLLWFMSSIKTFSRFQKTRPRVLFVLFYILAISKTLWLCYNSVPLAFTVGSGNWWSSKPSDNLTAAQPAFTLMRWSQCVRCLSGLLFTLGWRCYCCGWLGIILSFIVF